MKKLLSILSVLMLFLNFFAFFPNQVMAQQTGCESIGVIITPDKNPVLNGETVNFSISNPSNNLNPNSQYYLLFESVWDIVDDSSDRFSMSSGSANVSVSVPKVNVPVDYVVHLVRESSGRDQRLCQDEVIHVQWTQDEEARSTCSNYSVNPARVDIGTPFRVTVEGLTPNSLFGVLVNAPGFGGRSNLESSTNSSGTATVFVSSFDRTGVASVKFIPAGMSEGSTVCEVQVEIEEFVSEEMLEAEIEEVAAYDFCALTDDEGCADCQKKDGVWTALGCFETDLNQIVAQFVRFGLGMAGGIALIIMLYAVFIMATAAGDPEKYNAGKQTITAAIAGLLFIIFSAVILQIIGVTILEIPGFDDSGNAPVNQQLNNRNINNI